ncbi:MAG: PAS domain S-box protein [Bacteroidia bacterium]|nr:PAS domain S-box protein [Bacteroidia bacterium]
MRQKEILVLRLFEFNLILFIVVILVSFFQKDYRLLSFEILGVIALSIGLVLIKRKQIEISVVIAGVFCYIWLASLPFFTGYLSGVYLNFLNVFLVLSYILESKAYKRLNIIVASLALSAYFIIENLPQVASITPAPYLNILSISTGFVFVILIWYRYQKDISAQNQSLEETRSFLKMLVDQNPMAIVTKNNDLRITFANKTALDVYDVDQDIILGKSNEELQEFVLEGSDYIKESEEQVLQTGEVYKDILEFHPSTASGPKWFKSQKKPLLDNKGKIHGMIIFAEDITIQKKAEEALLESESRYRNLTENNQFGMATDQNGFLTSVNNSLCEMTGYKRNELVGRNVYEIVEVLDPALAQREVERLKNGEISFFELSCLYHRKDGTTGYALVRKSLIKNMEGEVVEQLATIADISALKEKEIELNFSQKKYQGLFESMPLGLLLIDTQGKLIPLESNKKWEEMVGFTNDRESFKSLLDFSPDRQADGQLSKEKLDEIFHRYHQDFDVTGFEWNFTASNGKEFPSYCILQPVYPRNQILTMVIVRDISEEKRQANTIKHQMVDLNEKNRQLGQFGYVVSHNFRSSVANIMGLQEILKEYSNDSVGLKDTIAMLGQVVQKLDEAIKDLNLIFSYQNESLKKFSSIDLKEVFEEMDSSFEHEILDLRAQIAYQIEGNTVVNGIKSYYSGIFQNLLSNSLKYHHPGRAPRIRIESEHIGDNVCVKFSDNGRGIDMEKFGNEIFNLYRRFHDEVEGKGMGLYLVKIQTEVMNGRVTVESQVGKGTTFTFYFPAATMVLSDGRDKSLV